MSAPGSASKGGSPKDSKGSKAGSRAGSHAGSRSGSRAGSVSGTEQKPQSMGFDRSKYPLREKEGVSRRLEVPPEAYYHNEDNMHPFARRPGFNTSGKPTVINVNQFRVTKIGAADVYQFDLAINPVPIKPVIIEKIWDSSKMQNALKQHKGTWIYDRRKLAWSTNKIKEIRTTINIDEDKGRPSDSRNTFNVALRNTGKIRLQALHSYLTGEMAWDNSVLECMNFLDHVIRETPQKKMRMIKRLFFSPSGKRADLNNSMEVIQGLYASIRMNQSIQEGGVGLGINVNIANCAFWLSQNFEQLVREYIRAYKREWEMSCNDYYRLGDMLKPIVRKTSSGKHVYEMSEAFKVVQKLCRIKFFVKHRGKEETDKLYTLKRFAHSPSYGPDGGNSRNYTFDKKEQDGTTRKISIFNYFKERYDIELQLPSLPIVESTRGGAYPMEACYVPRYNRYPFKLNPMETARMIKFAVQRPPQRLTDIMTKAAALGWATDPILKEFGIAIDPKMARVNARIIPNPDIQFGSGKHNPGITGRWDLRGKKFFKCPPEGLRSWGLVALENCVDKPVLQNFAKAFMTAYRGHGATIKADPLLLSYPPGAQHHYILEESYKAVGKQFKATPQIIFYVLVDRTAWIYERMKKNADCRWAVLSQMMLVEHVIKAQPQYCSNVAMKVNAKLGGITSRIPGPKPSDTAFFKVPTMMIGVDVSHAAPGAHQASMAAVCCSIDKDAAFFLGDAQTNGKRVEILLPRNVQNLLPGMLQVFFDKNKCWPQHVFYLRDGVSEGQFCHLMEHEISEVYHAFKDVKAPRPKVTVIVATKRHNIRFFPEREKDKNGNPIPGTIVDKEVTHPFHYDFYLCSHVAIQGTARPVHYSVIHDDVKLKPDDLQKMIYQQCYQYIRATTPVSLHPAVYYAHLCGARARQHENVATSDQVPLVAKNWVLGHTPGPGAKIERPNTSQIDPTLSEPILPMGGDEARDDSKKTFREGMWYI